MNFKEFDEICLMASQANPKASVRIFSMFPNVISFRWEWFDPETRRESGLVQGISVAEIDNSKGDVLNYFFAACRHAMEQTQ